MSISKNEIVACWRFCHVCLARSPLGVPFQRGPMGGAIFAPGCACEAHPRRKNRPPPIGSYATCTYSSGGTYHRTLWGVRFLRWVCRHLFCFGICFCFFVSLCRRSISKTEIVACRYYFTKGNSCIRTRVSFQTAR